MDGYVVEPLSAVKSQRPRLSRLLAKLRVFVAGLLVPEMLDLETMPDRVKRDLGFLDGREPRYEDERIR